MTDRIVPPQISEHPAPISTQEYFDADDLGRRYKASSRSIFRWADRGLIPAGTRIGALRRWSRRTIEDWESRGCRPVRSTQGGGA